MGRIFVVKLEGRIYSCKHCRTHLASCDDTVSKSFYCRHGKAYLFKNVVNVTTGEKEDRLMMTGLHTVADIFCVGCGSIVGWKYESAHEKSQKYKEGKSVLERNKMCGPDGNNDLSNLQGSRELLPMQMMLNSSGILQITPTNPYEILESALLNEKLVCGSLLTRMGNKMCGPDGNNDLSNLQGSRGTTTDADDA